MCVRCTYNTITIMLFLRDLFVLVTGTIHPKKTDLQCTNLHNNYMQGATQLNVLASVISFKLGTASFFPKVIKKRVKATRWYIALRDLSFLVQETRGPPRDLCMQFYFWYCNTIGPWSIAVAAFFFFSWSIEREEKRLRPKDFVHVRAEEDLRMCHWTGWKEIIRTLIK